MEELNIVDLIENNPITKLSQTYNNKLLSRIKDSFNDFEQQIFITSFYCYLNYDAINDFVIDFDNIWKWLGFSTKQKALILLEKNFELDKDYKNLLNLQVKQELNEKKHGGHNKEIYMLNIKTFKSFCIKAGTKKANEIHEYFIKLENILQKVVEEESNELKLQLESQKKIIENNEKEKELLREKTIIDQFPINTQCIYYGKIDNKSLGKPNSKMYHEDLIKFGQSNNLAERIKCHKKNFDNFTLIAAFKVKNKIEIENAIKRHPLLEKRMRSLVIDNINYRELLAVDNENFTIEKIDEYLRNIIKENEYNIENYNLLIEKNYKLENEIRKLQEQNKEKDECIEKITSELQNYKSDATTYYQKKICSNYSLCKYGYFLYAFECENMRYKCSIVRQKDYETIITNLKNIDNNGEMKYHVNVYYPFSEKIMIFLMKNCLTFLGNNKYEGSYENVKKIIDITAKLENILIKKCDDLDKLLLLFNEENLTCLNEKNNFYVDPEIPVVRKSKRSIDQINKDTGEIINTFESIEAAGRSLGLTTGTAIGIAVREKRICQGFIWRYSGISKEDQYSEQPVIKICCSTGEKFNFKTIADAARDSKISAPALRQRIITNVHINDHHWVFDKNATHYK
jgi:hypothetical protein